jgi:long-chain acyl-CoA synthetase
MPHFDSPLAAFLHWEDTAPNKPFLRQPINGSIKEYTYKTAGEEIRRLATGLQSFGMEPGSHVALISKNCAHWLMADLAIMMAGYVSIPLYPTLNTETIKLILEHSESKAIIIGKLDNYEAQKAGIPAIIRIGIEAYGIQEENSWETLVEQNEPMVNAPALKKDDLITIMYTSGTTGVPKGVMHTVGNIAKVANTATDILPIPPFPRFFSYLPLSHVAERLAIEMQGIHLGAVFNFPESLATFPADLEAAQPHMFFAVPRIWDKFQEKILEKMPQKKLNTLLSIPLLGNIVRKKIIKKLGLSDARYMASGAAPISVSTLEWYEKLGITIHQAYGMTEDCILSHYNLPGTNRIGTVGQAVPGVTPKLSPEGEICLKSDVLMKGYFKNPEQTAEMFDEEGYLKTGDLGEYDHDGFLTITGRVKDQFKTDKGKYISPAPIELELLKNIDIDQVCLVGMGIPQPIALVICPPSTKNKSKEVLMESLMNSITEVNPSLAKHEKIEKVVVMKEDWSVDNGLLTPTMKVKRNQVEKIHMPMYKSWFKESDKVIFE